MLIDATSLGELAAFRINPADYPALVHARLTPFGEDGRGPAWFCRPTTVADWYPTTKTIRPQRRKRLRCCTSSLESGLLLDA